MMNPGHGTNVDFDITFDLRREDIPYFITENLTLFHLLKHLFKCLLEASHSNPLINDNSDIHLFSSPLN